MKEQQIDQMLGDFTEIEIEASSILYKKVRQFIAEQRKLRLANPEDFEGIQLDDYLTWFYEFGME